MASGFRWEDIIMKPAHNPKVRGIQAVKQSISFLLSVERYEWPFNAELGAGIEDLLFEPIDDDTAAKIMARLFSAISRWDPRVMLTADTKVEPHPDRNLYELTLSVNILGEGGIEDRFSIDFLIPALIDV